MTHELKIETEYFKAVLSGEKTFEVRKFDRPFSKGDLLALNEIENKTYTGRSCIVYIDYMLADPKYVKPGYVILSIKPCDVIRITSPFNIRKPGADYSVELATERFEIQEG